MRLVILNPHVNYCGKMVFNWLFGFPHHHKYTYLWQECLKDPSKDLIFFVDGTQSSFYQTIYFKKTVARSSWFLKMFSIVEFWIWMRINHVDTRRCKVRFSMKYLDPKNDIIFSFGVTSFDSPISKYQGIVLVHMTHYHLHTEDIVKYVSTLQHKYLVAENDLTQNQYFKHYFPDIKYIYQLPLAISSDRFKRAIPFKQRILKCFASGSMSIPSSVSYTAYFGEGAALNPMRETIYQHKDELKDVIGVYIYPHNSAIKGLREIQADDGFFSRFAKKYLPAWVLTGVLHYKLPFFSFDIVERYNQYTMFTSPEERTGLPSMKPLEGILCGAVLVGIDDPMYTNIGFKDGVNYVAYKENDLADLVRKIRHYQHHPEELEKIAERGHEFTMAHFAPEKVLGTFWKDLEMLLNSFNKGNAKLRCSFFV